MNRAYRRRARAGFTLTELVIVIALLLLVGGMVTSFIVFMNGYNARNESTSLRVKELTLLRQETDKWFSYADSAGYTVTFGGTALAEAGGDGTADPPMQIIYTATEQGCSFAFVYAEAQRTELSFENAYSVRFYADTTTEGDEAALLRFTVHMHVRGQVYACEVTYA